METSTEWLFNKLLKAEPNILEWNKYLEQAKEKEKDQIIDFAYGCVQHISREDIEQYFNRVYQNK